MKLVRFSKTFEKNYKIRVSRNQKLQKQFHERYALFINNINNPLLRDHALSGKQHGRRAFSVTSDVRVIYQVTDEYYRFLDIGTHNQVYR